MMRNHLTGLGMVGHVKPKADARTLRSAAIYTLGFLVVFLISLVVAQGSEGPPRSTTHSCGSYVYSGRKRRRYVAYATRLDCVTAGRVARAYTAGHVCRRASNCKAMIYGLDCLTAGSAGPGLGWVSCGHTRHIHPPRAFFSVNHPGPPAAEAGPSAPSLPS